MNWPWQRRKESKGDSTTRVSVEVEHTKEAEADHAENHEQVNETWARTSDAVSKLRLLEIEAELLSRGVRRDRG